MDILIKDVLERDNISKNNGKPILLIADDGTLFDTLEQPVISLRRTLSDSYVSRGIGKMEATGIINSANRICINEIGRCDTGIRGAEYEKYLAINRKLAIIYQIQSRINKKLDISTMLLMSEEVLRNYLKWSVSLSLEDVSESLKEISDLDIDSTFSSILINGSGLRSNTRKVRDICIQSKLPIRYIDQEYINISEVVNPVGTSRSILITQGLFDLLDKNYTISNNTEVLSKNRAKRISLISRRGI